MSEQDKILRLMKALREIETTEIETDPVATVDRMQWIASKVLDQTGGRSKCRV